MQPQRSEHATRLASLVLFSVSLSLGASPAGAQPPTADTLSIELRGAALVISQAGGVPRQLTLPCEPVAQQRTAMAGSSQRLYLACAQRVLALDVSAESVTIVADTALASPVSAVHESGGHAWLELQDGSARRLDLDVAPEMVAPSTAAATLTAPVAPTVAPAPAPLFAPPPPPGSTPAPQQPFRPAAGHVTAVDDRNRQFSVDIGSEDGLTAGAPVVVSSGEPEGSEVLATVRSTTARTALVKLSYGDLVTVGQRAERADFGARRSYPAMGEWPYTFSLQADLLPGLVLDNVGVNLAVQGEATLHRGLGVFIAHLSPSGVSVAKRTYGSYYDDDTGDDFGFGGGYLLGGVDLGFVAVSAGLGVTRLYYDEREEYSAALTLPLRLRVGREDSFHVQVTQIAGYEQSRLQWLGIDIQVLVPAGPVWIFAEGGGGRMPAFFGTGGMRFPLSGNGGPGSLLMKVGVGASGTTANSSAQIERIGPAVRLGLERRY